MTAPEEGVLYVVAKAPQEGATKTRLSPPLSPAAAAQLARAFLLDTIETVRSAGITVRVICRGEDERAPLEQIARGMASVHVQGGHGLGDALSSAFAYGLGDGFRAAGVLAMDTPTLAPTALRRGFTCLEQPADVALGPTQDGGYYLLTARAVHRTLFRDMPWSTSTVAQETLDRCRRAGLRHHLLGTWRDVDYAADLEWLKAELHRTPAHVAQHTRRALAQVGADHSTYAGAPAHAAAG